MKTAFAKRFLSLRYVWVRLATRETFAMSIFPADFSFVQSPQDTATAKVVELTRMIGARVDEGSAR